MSASSSVLIVVAVQPIQAIHVGIQVRVLPCSNTSSSMEQARHTARNPCSAAAAAEGKAVRALLAVFSHASWAVAGCCTQAPRKVHLWCCCFGCAGDHPRCCTPPTARMHPQKYVCAIAASVLRLLASATAAFTEAHQQDAELERLRLRLSHATSGPWPGAPALADTLIVEKPPEPEILHYNRLNPVDAKVLRRSGQRTSGAAAVPADGRPRL